MKKSLFYIPLVALAMASCSENDFSKQPGGPEDEAGSSYITINIVNGSDVASRADDDPTPGSQVSSPGYEVGSAEENKVESVTFFFFHENGNVASIKGDGSYLFTLKVDEDKDYNDEVTSSTPSSGNVEKVLKATIVINSTEGDLLPAGIVAIINPSDDIQGIVDGTTKIATIDDLYKVLDYSTQKTGKFVITNSVYVDAEGDHIRATKIDPKHYKANPTDAINDPVDMYVERVVAKVRVTNSLTPKTVGGQIVYETGETYNTGDGESKNPIYVKLSNWNTTARADRSHLIKRIKSNSTNDGGYWADALLGSSKWNNTADSRSFWAINPSDVEIKYDDYYDADSFTFDANGKNYTYLQENAAPYTDQDAKTDEPSVVIIAGQLIDKNGKPLGLADVGGIKYVVEYESSTVDGKHAKTSAAGEETIKKAILSYLTPMLYTVEEKDGKKEVRSINVDDVVIYTGTEMKNKEDLNYVGDDFAQTGAKDYKVYIQLTSDAQALNWSTSKDEENETFMTTKEVNKELFYLGGAKVWTEGLTYYYFPIRHLGPAPTVSTAQDGSTSEAGVVGTWGVVRNHLYDASITKLTGLGTPVFDPEETIYPQHPDVDETYIAAQINILSWKIVHEDVILKW